MCAAKQNKNYHNYYYNFFVPTLHIIIDAQAMANISPYSILTLLMYFCSNLIHWSSQLVFLNLLMLSLKLGKLLYKYICRNTEN